jgi:hypothetical protein
MIKKIEITHSGIDYVKVEVDGVEHEVRKVDFFAMQKMLDAIATGINYNSM